MLTPARAMAQDDFPLFRLTDVRGDLRIEYQLDDQDFGSSSFETQGTWEEQFYLDTESFVYHPGLLNMRLGGGPLLVQQEIDATGGSNSNKEVLWNYDAELNFLDLKAYPFTLFFGRAHPGVSTSLAGRFLTETNNYGIRGRLEGVLTEAPVNWGFRHWDSIGSGLGTTVNESLDEAFVRAQLSYRKADRTLVKLESTERVSSSGSTGLPLQESTTKSQTAEISSDNFFGANNGVALRQNLSIREQDTRVYSSDHLSTLRYGANVSWMLGADTRALGTISHSASDREDAKTRQDGFTVQLSGKPSPDLQYRGEVRGSRETDQAFSRERVGGEGWASYSRPFSFGQVTVTGSLLGGRTDQQADEGLVQVFDEPLLLAGTTPVDLANAFVETTSVVVTNVPKTQVFVEGLDYRLVTAGSVTSIQRLIDGNIVDGQTVLADYQYLAGGTVQYDSIGSALGVSADFYKHLRVFARYNALDNSITSGTPTTPLNNRKYMEIGSGVDWPLRAGWTAGGEVRYMSSDEDISPYQGETFSAFLQGRLPMALTLRLSSLLDRRDIENSVEDVNLLRYETNLAWRLSRGGQVSYLASFSRDDGGSLPREERRQSLRYDWGYRQMRIALGLVYVDETQGDTRRKSTRLSAQLLRAF